jgi:hypothetical protein
VVLHRPFFIETFRGPVPVGKHFAVSDLCGTKLLQGSGRSRETALCSANPAQLQLNSTPSA